MTSKKPFHIFLYIGIFVCAAGVIFSLAQNTDCFEIEQDGGTWQIYFDYQSRDRAPFSQNGVDALQGSFDTYYPLENDYTIPGAIYRIMGAPAPSPQATYIIYTISLMLVMLLVGRSLQVGAEETLLGMALSGFFFPPLIIHHIALVFRFLDLNPIWMQLIILSTIIIISFWSLDGKWTPRRIMIMLLPTFCLSLEILSTGAMVIFTPAVVIYAIGSFWISNGRSELVQKLLAGFLPVLFIVLTGHATYLYGLEAYSDYNFFGHEFDTDVLGLGELSYFFAAFPFGTLFIGLGIIGAIWTAVKGSGKLRQFARTHLLATTLFFLFGTTLLILSKKFHYSGSWPFYFEAVFLPFAAIFSAIFFVNICRKLIGLLLSWRSGPGQKSHDGFVFLFFVVIIVGYNIFEYEFGNGNRCTNKQVYLNLKTNKIVDYLRKNIALTPGKTFKGIAATIDWTENFSAINSRHMNLENYYRFTQTGNDLRMIGLWKFNIPTLYENTTFISAPYYLLLTEFLARPEDRQTRSGLILTKIDPKMLQLWGVRYVITDQMTDVGSKIFSIPIPKRPPVSLIELPGPNLGNYSPTHVKPVSDFHSGLILMHEPKFDPKDVVITNLPIQEPLTIANHVHLTYETYGFHIKATSPGHSVLVLPAQFSYCWKSVGSGSPKLFRADLMQLGVEFSGKLDARLIFHHGPLFANSCRLKDLAEIKNLKIDKGRTIPRIIPLKEPIE